MNGFLSDIISPIVGVPQGSVLSPLLFLFTSLTYQNLTTDKTRNPSFPDDPPLWAANKNVQFEAELLHKDLQKLAKVVCQMEKKTKS